MSRKIAITLIVLSLLSVSIYADDIKIGASIGSVLETDIQAQINGYLIPSYNIDNNTAVSTKDLQSYGFNITWDGEKREVKISLNVNKPFTSLSYESNRIVAIGKKIGNVLYTDIKTFLDGKEVQSFNMNGSTLIYMKDLKKYGSLDWNSSERTLNLSIDNYFSENKTVMKNQNDYYPYALTDDEIKESIAEGKKGYSYVRTYEEEKYTLNPNQSTYNIFIDNMQVLTPYSYIMRSSAMAAYKYDEYSLEQAKEFYDTFVLGKGIVFELIYNCTNIDSNKNINVVLKQGDNVIHPYNISGLDSFAQMTNSWPKFPAYQAIININFSNLLAEETIDFTKKAQLIIIHAPEMESVFDIDFSQFK